MGVVRALAALTITFAVLGAGFWIGKRWIPPLETEVVDGMVVEKICRAWTDGCKVYARDGTTPVYYPANVCEKRTYKCTTYGW